MAGIFTVRQFSERHPAFSEASLRWLIFTAHSPDPDQNAGAGMEEAGAIRRVGRRVLLDEDRFFQWLDGKIDGSR